MDLTILTFINANFVQLVTIVHSADFDFKMEKKDVTNVILIHSGSELQQKVFLSVSQRSNVTLLRTMDL